MKKRMLLSAVILLALFLTLLGTYKLMNSRTYQLFGGITDHVKTNKKVVALTFDDGPTENVDNILTVLDQYHAKATFFLIGNELRQHRDLGKKIAAARHQIGNHTYSHKRMIFKSPNYIKREIEQTDQLIRKTGFKGEIDVRPPNGKKLVGLPIYLNKHHRDTITWNLEPDTFYTSIKNKVNYVKQNIKPGSIILLHPMYDQTGNEQKTIEGILKELTEKGYKFVTVNELQNEF
ncbi:polysaccharide deacetylase family protein [Bacillus salipaludis]|uniref:polysaccharide deacetylase family protein n=1 Tax=Bacillus salipaludis TaxID=2547811 RepID=UPI002E242C85|nr:polysaccharide deacetylase family protein [Bacillus salipaludis]